MNRGEGGGGGLSADNPAHGATFNPDRASDLSYINHQALGVLITTVSKQLH